jgi:hypothetical protein
MSNNLEKNTQTRLDSTIAADGRNGGTLDPETTGSSLRWLAGGAAVLLVAFVMLEWLEPYYFCQDDVLVAELPGVLYGCRNVWHGEFPEYNPYTLMGGPYMAEGVGLTYPPLCPTYAVARHILHDEYAVIEVFAFLHLAVGYAVMFAVARGAGMRASVACLVSLSFVLCGAVLIMGRSWHTFLIVAAMSPLLVLAAERLRRESVGWRWVLATGIVIGVYYHGAFPQLWLFAMLFFALHVAGLWLSGVVPFRRALWSVPAVFLGVASMFPVFYLQWRLSRDMIPYGGVGNGVGAHVCSFFLPFPLSRDTLPNRSPGCQPALDSPSAPDPASTPCCPWEALRPTWSPRSWVRVNVRCGGASKTSVPATRKSCRKCASSWHAIT